VETRPKRLRTAGLEAPGVQEQGVQETELVDPHCTLRWKTSSNHFHHRLSMRAEFITVLICSASFEKQCFYSLGKHFESAITSKRTLSFINLNPTIFCLYLLYTFVSDIASQVLTRHRDVRSIFCPHVQVVPVQLSWTFLQTW